MHKVEFGTSVAVGDFERLVRGSGVGGKPSVLLDFSEARWIEMTTMQLVNSMVAKRDREGLETRIGLPKGDLGRNARDALRAWAWPKSLQTISSSLFTEIVTEEDYANFKQYGGDPGEQAYRITSEANRTIQFNTWALNQYRNKIRITDEILRLDEFKPILQVLNKRLTPPTDHEDPEISEHMMSRIVFEAMTNAVRHPAAEFIQVSSTIQQVKDRSYFTITFWDDGKSIWRTLRDSVRKEHGIKMASNKRFKTHYEVKCKNWDISGFEGDLVSSTDLPDENSPAEHFFLASLFPGVTSDPTGLGQAYHESLQQQEPELARTGMGLFALTRAAVHTFGGTVSFRNSGLFMNVKKRLRNETDTRNYSIKISGDFEEEDDFIGNMITVRLPLKN